MTAPTEGGDTPLRPNGLPHLVECMLWVFSEREGGRCSCDDDYPDDGDSG